MEWIVNVNRFKLATPSCVKPPGSPFYFYLKPLPSSELDLIQDALTAFWNFYDDHIGEFFSVVDKMAATLERALCDEKGNPRFSKSDILSGFTCSQIAHLFVAQRDLQDASIPDSKWLEAEACLQHLEGQGQLVWDMVMAGSCESVVDYYGKSVDALTDGQMLYYLVLRDLNYKLNIKGEHRWTLHALEKKANRKANRSLITKNRNATSTSSRGQEPTRQ